jgi:hypothetical protein
MEEKETIICQWIGDGERCRHPSMYGKAYCEPHHERMYLTVLPEMADYIIEKELSND